MASDAKPTEAFSLRRWSRRKLEAAREPVAAEVPPPVSAPPAPGEPMPVAAAATGPPAESALPPVESLTPDSNFAAFMQPKVDEGLRREALKKLFADPHFNVMDGLDVYIDDYTKTVPIPASVLERLAQSGFVRDLAFRPVEEKPPAEPAAEPPALAGDANATALPAAGMTGAAADAPPADPAPPDPVRR